MFSYWDEVCIRCHTTAGVPGFDPSLFLKQKKVESKISEMGISCESCHGPAQKHIEANANPARRYYYHETGKADPTIVNPARLKAERSSHVCAQCHSIHLYVDNTAHFLNGSAYTAGEDLEDTRIVVRLNKNEQHPLIRPTLKHKRLETQMFWPDGMVRIAGREFNGMSESLCYTGGKLACISCHSLHKSDPNDQLAAGMEGDQACFQCHPQFKDKVAEHTHHKPGTEGSKCYNCHMPFTTYGLLKAVRSHLIDSPTVDAAVKTGRPNACNLCHLDKTLAWSGEHLDSWYGRKTKVQLNEEEKTVAASVLCLLPGDANQRALMAWAMGWPAAQEASGTDWLAPYLGNLLNDSYPAVRFIAHRSLSTLEPYRNLEYDFSLPEDLRGDGLRRVLETWQEEMRKQGSAPRDRTSVLLDPDGNLKKAIFDHLLGLRDDPPISLEE